MVAEESDGSMQWFHFFDGIPVFLGQWYQEGFHAKSMVLKRFTPFSLRIIFFALDIYMTRRTCHTLPLNRAPVGYENTLRGAAVVTSPFAAILILD